MNKSVARISEEHPKRRSSYRPKTLSAFRHWQPEDGFKYEWNRGVIEKRTKMDFTQSHIADNLLDFFQTLPAHLEGRLVAEIKTEIKSEVLRVPDLAYYNNAQRRLMSNGQPQIPEFAIEIISPTDRQIKIMGKLREYFETGVKVVWHIYPDFETVYVYLSTEDVTICKGETVCSADSVIKGFKIKAKAIFQKP
jgi:Uma2 family endonuclease